jgi:hypothetical protein
MAALAGRDHVLPEDLHALVAPVLAHRIVLTPAAELGGRTAEEVLTAVVGRLAVPPAAAADRARRPDRSSVALPEVDDRHRRGGRVAVKKQAG